MYVVFLFPDLRSLDSGPTAHLQNNTLEQIQYYLWVVVRVLLYWPVTEGIPEGPEASQL